MATCPESDLTTFASDGLPRFHESYSQNVLKFQTHLGQTHIKKKLQHETTPHQKVKRDSKH